LIDVCASFVTSSGHGTLTLIVQLDEPVAAVSFVVNEAVFVNSAGPHSA